MKKAQLKELIKQSMSEFNDPEYLDLMKKADDTGRGYAERDAFRNQAYDLKIGAMTPDEEKMVFDYEEEEANKHALEKEEPLEELISKADKIITEWLTKK
jgi:protein associated with RNAse G/E